MEVQTLLNHPSEWEHTEQITDEDLVSPVHDVSDEFIHHAALVLQDAPMPSVNEQLRVLASTKLVLRHEGVNLHGTGEIRRVQHNLRLQRTAGEVQTKVISLLK